MVQARTLVRVLNINFEDVPISYRACVTSFLGRLRVNVFRTTGLLLCLVRIPE